MGVKDFFKAFTRTSTLPRKTQQELFKVYTTLGLTLGSCAAGCYSSYHISVFEDNSILLSLLIIGLTLGIHIVEPSPSNLAKRTTMLLVLGWLMGCTLEPLVSDMVVVGEGWSILMTAGVLTALMFAGFSYAVLRFNSPKMVYAVGSATTALSALSWVYVLGIFYPTNGLVNLLLVIWLASSCIYLVSHMNRMLDKAQRGESLDPVVGASLFFNSLVSIFVKVAVLLSRDKQSKDKRSGSGCRKSSRRGGVTINLGTWSFGG